MTSKIKELLQEAYRRYTTFPSDKPLMKRWLGLGTEAEYRPAIQAGLMCFVDDKKPEPRVMGWLVLTEKGVDELLKLAPYFHEQAKNKS